MKKYKDLTRLEKINAVSEYRTFKTGCGVKDRYLAALRNDDTPTIEYFEKMGEDVNKILENTACFEKAQECGFIEPKFDEHGWVRYDLGNKRETPVCESNIITAVTPSGKYVCGVEYITGAASGGWWPSIWDVRHDTESEAKLWGLDYLLRHMEYGLEAGKTDSCGNYNKKLINKTLKEIEKLYNDMAINEIDWDKIIWG